MNKSWTFGQKLAAGNGVLIALSILIGAVAIYALRTVVAREDHVTNVSAAILVDAQRLNFEAEQRIAEIRGYLLTHQDNFLDRLQASRAEFAATLERLSGRVDTDESRRQLDLVARSSTEYERSVDDLVATARNQAAAETVERQLEQKVAPAREAFDQDLQSFVASNSRALKAATQAAASAASTAETVLFAIAVIAVLFAAMVAVVLTRLLSRQIGSAVGHVQSSSSELQAAATQQASGAKEQASAMNEITTTISELVATSRQIAESAQRVAKIAEQTTAAGRHGEDTVEKGQDSISGIRNQVNLVVTHMLDLGKKSQEIGAVIEIVSELAEQTNILAINATIEATGAGEAGRRFAVVADEIRKLADRVTSSIKEIRGLIEDVRSAVNTTVMATESSAKAVDAGSHQFTEVAIAFKQISALVTTTTDAAREIELSTRQQATAAEQVRLAVADVAQTTHETEASTGQTLQTASQLARLSRELLRLIQPEASAAQG